MTKEQYIKEAAQHGIVPGAVIRQFCGACIGKTFTVGPYDTWSGGGDDTLSVGSFNRDGVTMTDGKEGWLLFAFHRDQWAEVIDNSGLQHGDFIEGISQIMCNAIIEIAKTKHISTSGYYSDKDCILVYCNDDDYHVVSIAHPDSEIGKKHKRILSPGDFLNKLSVTDPYAPRTLTIEDRQVTFTKGYVTIGSTVFSNEAIGKILKNTF
jgi:hypothetical protein